MVRSVTNCCCGSTSCRVTETSSVFLFPSGNNFRMPLLASLFSALLLLVDQFRDDFQKSFLQKVAVVHATGAARGK